MAWTGLSRTTVIYTLRGLRNRGLLRPYTRKPKRETTWLVEVPEPALPAFPEGLQEEKQPRGWLADRTDPEDLELARTVRESLGPLHREELEREARYRFGDLAPEDLEKALVDLVAGRTFGPSRLARYT